MAHEAGGLLGSRNVQATSELHRLVRHNTDRATLDAGVTNHYVRSVQRLHLQEVAVIDHGLNDRTHVIRLVRRVRDQGVQIQIVYRHHGLLVVLQGQGLSKVVRRQEFQKLTHKIERVFFILSQVGAGTGHGVVLTRTTEGLHVHILTGHGLNDIRAGNEHVRSLIHHDDVVSQSGGVRGTASAGAHNDRNLRNHTGGAHVHAEDIGEHRQRCHTLLDAGAAAVVNADDGATVLQRKLLHLHDLLAVDLREGTAVHGEILRVHGDQAAIHRAVAGDQAVTQRLLRLHAECGGAVAGEGIKLNERTLVQKHLDTLAGGVLAACVLLLDSCLTAGRKAALSTCIKISELTGGGAQIKFLLEVLGHYSSFLLHPIVGSQWLR